MIGPMISASGTTQILVATKPVDFRKQADSLAALVQEALGADPFSGAVYVFRAKCADRVRVSDDGPSRTVPRAPGPSSESLHIGRLL